MQLPATHKNAYVTGRTPYTMPGSVVVEAGAAGVQFPSGMHTHGTNRDFEITRIVPYVLALDVNGAAYAAQPSQDLLRALTQVSIMALGINEQLTKSSQDLITLINHQTGAWELNAPFLLGIGDGLQISVANSASNAILGGAYAKSRVYLTLVGSLLCLGPVIPGA